MTLIKICGITNLDDALCAVAADADMLGFNFYRRSPRFIQPAAARQIIDQLPRSVVNVGVFVNEELDALRQIATASGIAVFQLHGDESSEYCGTLKAEGRTIMKVFSMSSEFSPEDVAAFDAPLIMLDSSTKEARGGTGTVGNWSIARRTRELCPTMFLAGGLSVENVGAAISEVRPFGVDACSALERGPGKKDHAKVRDFIAAVRAVDRKSAKERTEDL